MTTEIAIRDTWALQPRNPEEAKTSAELLVNSTFVPASYRGKPADVYAAVLYGQEIGLPQMQALNSIAMIDGKATLSADAMAALVRAQGHQIRISTSTADKCVVRGRRAEDRDDPDGWQEFSFTIQEAKLAGLTNLKISRKTGKPTPGPWQLYPADMLRWRAMTRLCKAVFSDAIRGLSGLEEMRDVETADQGDPVAVQPVNVTPPTRTTSRRHSAKPAEDAGSEPAARPDRPARERTPRGQAIQPAAEAVAPEEVDTDTGEIIDAEIVDDNPTEVAPPVANPVVQPATTTAPAQALDQEDPSTEPVSPSQRTMIHATLGDRGITDRERRLDALTEITGRTITSTNDLTRDEARQVIDELTKEPPKGKVLNEQLSSINECLKVLEMGKNEALPFYGAVVGHEVKATKDLTFKEARLIIVELRKEVRQVLPGSFTGDHPGIYYAEDGE